MFESLGSRIRKAASSTWAPWLVLLLAFGVRCWNISSWSLWEDEEGTIYHSLNPDNTFPSYFPIFFPLLRWTYAITGVSADVGRLLALGFGIATVAVVCFGFKKISTGHAALIAGLLLALNLGHLFFSQSVRYYTALAFFQTVCIWAYLIAVREKSYGYLAFGLAMFILSLLTHFSALLLAPVFVAHAVYLLLPWSEPGQGVKRMSWIFVGLLCLILLAFTPSFVELTHRFSGAGYPAGRDPVHILVTFVAYLGLPVFALGLLGMAFDLRKLDATRVFIALASAVPLAEIVVIGLLDLVNVCWYYVLFSFVFWCLMAGQVLEDLVRTRHNWLAPLLLFICILFSASFLALYNTSMHGDRPRWEEAVLDLRQRVSPADVQQGRVRIYASAPGVVAHYLGFDPAQTGRIDTVSYPHACPPEKKRASATWYVMRKEHYLTLRCREWLDENCIRVAAYPAHTGPVDRTITLYRRK